MYELNPLDFADALDDDELRIIVKQPYRRRDRKFNAARRALREAGATYDHELRAWWWGDGDLDVLERLHALTHCSVWAVEAWDEPTADWF